MINIDIEKALATAICAAAVASFAIVPSAHAAPLFPPVHATSHAPSSEPDEQQQGRAVIAPYYRTQLPVPTTHAVPGGIGVAARIDIGPWYRAAN